MKQHEEYDPETGRRPRPGHDWGDVGTTKLVACRCCGLEDSDDLEAWEDCIGTEPNWWDRLDTLRVR